VKKGKDQGSDQGSQKDWRGEPHALKTRLEKLGITFRKQQGSQSALTRMTGLAII